MLKGAQIFNLGSKDEINVMKIVEIVCEQMKLHNVRYIHRNTTEDGRGCIGDVKFMRFDVSKLEALGWKPSMSSKEAGGSTVSELVCGPR